MVPVVLQSGTGIYRRGDTGRESCIRRVVDDGVFDGMAKCRYGNRKYGSQFSDRRDNDRDLFGVCVCRARILSFTDYLGMGFRMGLLDLDVHDGILVYEFHAVEEENYLAG